MESRSMMFSLRSILQHSLASSLANFAEKTQQTEVMHHGSKDGNKNMETEHEECLLLTHMLRDWQRWQWNIECYQIDFVNWTKCWLLYLFTLTMFDPILEVMMTRIVSVLICKMVWKCIENCNTKQMLLRLDLQTPHVSGSFYGSMALKLL